MLRSAHLLERQLASCRGVAQPGRAPGSGPGGRRFKSSLPDQFKLSHLRGIPSCGEYKTKGSIQRKVVAPLVAAHVELRPAHISIIVLSLPSNDVQIVVQGFIKVRFLPMVSQVALDGFYKYPDETMAPLTREDLYAFD